MDLLPPQSIVVTPGDEAVRRGGNLTVRARMEGFDPASANIHARMGGGAWQEVDMAGNAAGFEFSFFSIRESVQLLCDGGWRSQPDLSRSMWWTCPTWSASA